MYGGNTVSYKTIMDKVFRDFPFDEKVEIETSIEWLSEFMAHTNSGVVMEDKVCYLDVKDGRADLPSDLYKIKQTAQLTGVEKASDAECGGGELSPMRWSTDNFHARYHSDNRDYTNVSLNTYTVGQGFIFPSFNCGMVAIAYEAIPTDCDGYPTIPAEQQWLEAAAHYIAHRIARKMWLRNEMTSDKYQVIERDKEWYFAQAVNHSKQLNGVDEAESFKNQIVRTIPSLQDHSSFFANMQIPEQRNFRGRGNNSVGVSNNFSNLNSGIPTNSNSNAINYLPILITGNASSIINVSAVSISSISSIGSTAITNHGICFNTVGNPTTSDSVVALGAITAPGTFTGTMLGLTPNTTYYVRCFATHGTGTSYGNQITFTTLP
jgi:hypothetical protein